MVVGPLGLTAVEAEGAFRGSTVSTHRDGVSFVAHIGLFGRMICRSQWSGREDGWGLVKLWQAFIR